MSNILSTKVKFYRNLKDFKFDTTLSSKEQQTMAEKVLNQLKEVDIKGGFLSELSESVIDSLILNGQLDANFANSQGNKAYACNDNVSVEIGGEEHICVNAKSADIFTAYKNAKELDKKLCNKLNFAYSDKFGFLTSNITRVGSGMDLEVKLILPALNKLNAIKSLPKSNEKLIFNIKCLDVASGVYLISTGANLGYTEKQICELTHAYIDKICKLEIEACKQLNDLDTDEVLDSSKRAIAILNNCIKISQDEVYKFVSDILIAVNAKVENDIDSKKLEKILNLNNKNKKEFAKNIQNILNKK